MYTRANKNKEKGKYMKLCLLFKVQKKSHFFLEIFENENKIHDFVQKFISFNQRNER